MPYKRILSTFPKLQLSTSRRKPDLLGFAVRRGRESLAERSGRRGGLDQLLQLIVGSRLVHLSHSIN